MGCTKYVRVNSGTTKNEFIGICKRFADALGVTEECDRIEFLAECLENTHFSNKEIWVDTGCEWIALLDDGDIIQMEDGGELVPSYELVVLPTPAKDEYVIVERMAKEDLPRFLEIVASKFGITESCDRYEFIGVLLRDIPMIVSTWSDGSTSTTVKFDLAIYPSGEWMRVDREEGTYYDSKEPIQGKSLYCSAIYS